MSKIKEKCPECGGTEFEIWDYTYTCTSENGCCDFYKADAKHAAKHFRKNKPQAIRDAFAAGLKDAAMPRAMEMIYDGDPKSLRSMAYDAGLNVGEALLKEDE